MAKKTRKQKQRAAARRPGPVQAGRPPQGPFGLDDVAPSDALSSATDPVTAASAATANAAATGANSAAFAEAPVQRRRIERLSQAAPRGGRSARGPANAAAMFAPLETEDAAIPFDRVPYVPADLRRVAVMAALMVVLIIIAAIIVSAVVH